jgi:hypothetical protein
VIDAPAQKEAAMDVYEAPQQYNGSSLSLFLAGGITGCPDWQQEMIRALAHTRLVLFNPRRANFPMGDPGAAQEQIAWEHTLLRRATAISFWFPCETLNPITLYELGAWSMTNKPLFVGVHPDYQRKQDVIIQTKLARPDVAVVESFEELARHIYDWQLPKHDV